MAEMHVAIDGTVTTVGGTGGVGGTVGNPSFVSIAPSGNTVNAIPAVPSSYKFYTHAMTNIPGVVAANNFLSLFNPLASGKTMILYQFILSAYATGATSATDSLSAFRTTAASGGTLVAANTISRFVSTDADPVVEVRVGNPTVTTSGNVLVGFPPAITAAAAGSSGTSVSIPPGAGFVISPGQGVVYSTAAGNVNQLWNLDVVWAEF